MDDIFIKGTHKTPEVDFKASSGVVSISGKSIPENPVKFYTTLSQFVDEYLQNPKPETVVKVNLEYFNTSTSKCLVDLFKQFQKITTLPGKTIIVKWYYEEDDEEILDSGKDYSEFVAIPFQFIMIK